MRRRRGQRSAVSALIVIVGLGAVACSSSSKSSVAAHTLSQDALERKVGPALDRLGLRVQRVAVETRGGPQPTNEFSLYVKPALVETADAYAARFAPLTAAIVPEIFDAYPDVDWIDVCQERAGTPDGIDDAVPYTRIEVSREDAATVKDWAAFDLTALFALKRRAPHRVGILANEGVEQTRAWRTARTRAPTLDG